ncbi:hypothetical protein EZV62_022153 [Acer yangbiense]|uniref:GH18 domain-containing protein n=1 Tax=Acer yangbiense TaxID=1000413 RepID=A0A5C7H7M2_9ROSI|nr:hypothetical protein EZV62_022153 [Acer yangbiense]
MHMDVDPEEYTPITLDELPIGEEIPNVLESIDVVEASDEWSQWRDDLAEEIRNWTLEEEDVMISILEGIVADGGRCNTGSFRPAAYDMLNTSGFGWDDTHKCVTVAPEILEVYLKITKDMLQVQHSSMASKISTVIFKIFLLSLQLHHTNSQTWIRVGFYMVAQKVYPISEINSSLFTHLVFCCADLNSTSYALSISKSVENYFSNFTETVKQKNPSVTTLLCIGGPDAKHSIFSSMVNNSFYRKSFIDSSITTARSYGFEGLDFYWKLAETASDMSSLSILFKEWRDAITSEARNSSKSELIMTAMVAYSPDAYKLPYPIDSMQQYLNWIHVDTSDYSKPENWGNFTAAPAALYDPTRIVNTDSGIKAWIGAGLSANKLVLTLAYYGFAWKLLNSADNGIGAPANGPAISDYGFMEYDQIKNYIERLNAHVIYDSTYVVNYCSVETAWIAFDDVEAIRAKVSYAEEKGLRGYRVWQVSYDANWVLSQAAG